MFTLYFLLFNFKLLYGFSTFYRKRIFLFTVTLSTGLLYLHISSFLLLQPLLIWVTFNTTPLHSLKYELWAFSTTLHYDRSLSALWSGVQAKSLKVTEEPELTKEFIYLSSLEAYKHVKHVSMASLIYSGYNAYTGII